MAQKKRVIHNSTHQQYNSTTTISIQGLTLRLSTVIHKFMYLAKHILQLQYIILLWLVLVTVWLARSNGVTVSLPFKTHPSPIAQTTTQNDVPEMKEILSQDQNTRILGARKLVERVDVDKAQEILRNSGLPFTGEGHLAVHQVGFFAYKKYGVSAILRCKDYFLYACFHGAIIEAASDQGIEQIAKMTDQCKTYSSRYFQCVHAAGHAILAMWNYNLAEALKTCDQLYEKEDKFPEALSSCHNGAFMENLFGVHDWGTSNTPKRDWLSDDPYFPCNAFDEKYQKGCWLNQAARIYQMHQGDLIKTTQICEAIGNEQYTEWCMDNVARQIHPLTNGDVIKVFSLCQYTGQKWVDGCIIINAGSYYSVGDPKSAIAICGQINPVAKGGCYETIIAQVAGDSIAPNDKQHICQSLEPPFNAVCSSRLTI